MEKLSDKQTAKLKTAKNLYENAKKFLQNEKLKNRVQSIIKRLISLNKNSDLTTEINYIIDSIYENCEI